MTLLWGLLFGSIGVGFVMYGRKQRAPAALVCGIGLMVIPYLVSNTFLLVALGVALTAGPYFAQNRR